MRHIIPAAIFSFLACSSPAFAADFVDSTRCEAINKIPNNDKAGLSKAYDYIRDELYLFDLKHTEVGELGILAELSDKGMDNFVATIAMQCSNHPYMTIRNSASAAYIMIRNVEVSAGVAK